MVVPENLSLALHDAGQECLGFPQLASHPEEACQHATHPQSARIIRPEKRGTQQARLSQLVLRRCVQAESLIGLTDRQADRNLDERLFGKKASYDQILCSGLS